MGRAENAVCDACLQFLRLHRIPAWRSNSGAVTYPALSGGRRFVRYGVVGQPDITGLLPPAGRFLGVETKAGRGKQSDEQRAFQVNVEAAGGLYVLAWSDRELEAALKEAGVIR